MQTFRFVVLIFVAVVACRVVAQTAPAPSFPAINVLTPKSGDVLKQDFVTVKYVLTSSVSAASTPTFQLRLDNQEPVETTDTQYTFTGVPPGTHTVTIQVVDANDTPLPGLRNQVQFTVAPASNATSNPPLGSGAQTANASSRGDLPKTGSPLPLLSVIGMGMLVGGLASALRTRNRGGPTR